TRDRAGEPGSQTARAVGVDAGPSGIRAHDHERDRRSRRGPARPRTPPAAQTRGQRVARRGRSSVSAKATTKLGMLAPSPEPNSGNGSPTASNTRPTPWIPPPRPVGTPHWDTPKPT